MAEGTDRDVIQDVIDELTNTLREHQRRIEDRDYIRQNAPTGLTLLEAEHRVAVAEMRLHAITMMIALFVTDDDERSNIRDRAVKRSGYTLNFRL